VENITETRDLKESVRKIVEEIVSELNSESDGDYYYKLVRVDVESKDNETATVRIDVEYVTHFYEISEDVSEIVSELSGELSDEELERMYYDLYAEKLEEINNDYAIPLELHAELDLSSYYIGGGKLKILTSPVFCEEDYCDAGLWVLLKLEDIPIEILMKATNDIKYTIKSTITRVAEFHRI